MATRSVKKLGSLTLAGLLLVGAANAESKPALNQDTVSVQLSLSSIEKIKSTEEQGDELYFSITEYSSIERPRQLLVPNFPTHWLSSQLGNLSDVELWHKELQANESVMVLVSLIERDAPPWNVDDLIGTVKFKVKAEDGKVHKEWSVPNSADTRAIDMASKEFSFTGEQGQYHVTFSSSVDSVER